MNFDPIGEMLLKLGDQEPRPCGLCGGTGRMIPAFSRDEKYSLPDATTNYHICLRCSGIGFRFANVRQEVWA